ncbi:MAG: carbohydrate ABC transporter permease [Clostridiales bacterium]|nr:carbohydrate ABC transporter permease [Clostridiales bacterium]
MFDTKKTSFLKSVVIFALALFVLVPICILFAGSFMGADEVYEKIGPVLTDNSGRSATWFFLPEYITLRAYVELLLDSPDFFVMFWNSIRLVLPILIGQMLVAVPAAWGFAKFKFKGRKALFMVYIVLMLMPFQVTMVSNYIVLDTMHLLNTRLAVILPAIFSTFPVFIVYRFFKGIPDALLEAAAIDGAGPLETFIYIGIPVGAPGIAAAMILGFIEYWSMIEQPLTFIKDKALWPLSLYLPGSSGNQAAVALAASIMILVPPLLVFLVGQKYLERGIQAVGLKE